MHIKSDEELYQVLYECGWIKLPDKKWQNGVCPWDETIVFTYFGSNLRRCFSKKLPSNGKYQKVKWSNIVNLANLKDFNWEYDESTGLLTCEDLVAIRLKQV